MRPRRTTCASCARRPAGSATRREERTSEAAATVIATRQTVWSGPVRGSAPRHNSGCTATAPNPVDSALPRRGRQLVGCLLYF